MPSKPNTKDVYNQISSQFSASRSYIWPDLKPFIDQVTPNSTVLDVGCGNGRLLLGLDSSIKYTGFDLSTNLLNEAKKLHPQNNFFEGDLLDKNIWGKLGQYDYIFCIAVIHHLPTIHDHLFLLEQIKKHLKPNGKVLITAWNLWQPKLLKHHLDLKTKLINNKHVYIPFQGLPRFHFAHTLPYLKSLVRESKINLVIEKSRRNYLVHS